MNLLQNLLLSMPGGGEWMLIVIAVLVLFGAKKVPEFMRGLGKGIKEFTDAKEGVLNPPPAEAVKEKP